MNKEQFATLLKLSKTAPWIVDKDEALTSLLFDDCNNENSRDLVIDLLTRFNYWSREQYANELRNLAESVARDTRLTPQTTQIVGMAADESSDSSHLILYGLKMAFRNQGWTGYGEVNQFAKSYQKYKQNNDYKDIVLVDEFIGSGQTVISRVKEIRRIFDYAKVDGYRIIVKVLVSSSVGLEAIRKQGIEVDANLVINKGISDYYPPNEVQSKIEIMRELESILAPQIGPVPLPSLGYGSCESLYMRQEGNTPNCVFPFFWWPQYQDGARRNLIMERA
ncbi:hypothetical protein ORJ00_07700 [Rheinheimera baltica]|uniref:phosphoribosyltransferase-like protein n=1 Tax=Rheinheimera baltica TaxID=67576 RepID=UPI00273EC78A|nr:hypothetical protein [Rheinheimera baltica]MDP5142619.1 hypothetical protein [Rheinheimera baltica]